MSTNTAIQLKKSGETGNTPSNLQYGEVAINYADGKLYYKDDLNTIRYITNQDSFSTILANGNSVLAMSTTDILTINPGHGTSIAADVGSKTITLGVNEDQLTSFVRKTGDTMTGDLNISTANIDANYLIVETTLYSGLATRSSTPLPNLIAQFTGNTNSYVQVNAQNIDEHGSADFVVTSDVGNDEEFYIDMGINNSQFNDPEATVFNPLDGYLFVQGSSIDQLGGNLILGSTHTGTDTKFISGGANVENVIARIHEGGVDINLDLVVDGDITGPTITGLQSDIQTVFDVANSAGGNAITTISTSGYPDVVANSKTSQLTFIAQTGIAIGLNPENSTISIATNTFGASNLAVDFGAVTDILGSVTFDYGYVS
jgi:hypothetical protein